MSVHQEWPSDSVELLPSGFLQPLQAAMTQEEHRAVVAQEEQQVRRVWCALGAAEQVGSSSLSMPSVPSLQREAEAKAEAERAEAEAEAQRLELLRQQYEAAIPDEIQQRVQAAVDREVAALRKALEEQVRRQDGCSCMSPRFRSVLCCVQQAELTAKLAALESRTVTPAPAKP
jgi:hypothetical protein